jgi:hypothetical protein
LRTLGERLGGDEGAKKLGEAIRAYRAALEVWTKEKSPADWAFAQKRLGMTYADLKDWQQASEAYAEVFARYPDDKEAYGRLAALYHDHLFQFDRVFAITQQWLARHSDDVAAQADFAEAHFTVGRFAECRRRIDALLARPDVPANIKPALRAIEIASLMAEGKSKEIPAKLDALISEVSGQPAEFKVAWSFDGTRHYVEAGNTRPPDRDMLEKLFDALGAEDRDMMLGALNNLRRAFKGRGRARNP